MRRITLLLMVTCTAGQAPAVDADVRGLYIALLKQCLTMALWDGKDGSHPQPVAGSRKDRVKRLLKEWFAGQRQAASDPKADREEGRDWPMLAHTMIGSKRMNNLQACVESVLKNDVPGDLIEAGVWRGGASIFMRGILRAYGVKDRRVWVADSFEGSPPPNPDKYPSDTGDPHHGFKLLAISLEEVKSNFSKYGLLDEQVRFLKGWFKDTLPTAPFKELAVARLDGDMYESTMDGLKHLYPHLSRGGYLIVDDYGAVPACRQAVEDYRRDQGIAEAIQSIDGLGVFWQRSHSPALLISAIPK